MQSEIISPKREKLPKATYPGKDLLPAEGGGQDQEGEDELVQSGVGFNHREDLGAGQFSLLPHLSSPS